MHGNNIQLLITACACLLDRMTQHKRYRCCWRCGHLVQAQVCCKGNMSKNHWQLPDCSSIFGKQTRLLHQNPLYRGSCLFKSCSKPHCHTAYVHVIDTHCEHACINNCTAEASGPRNATSMQQSAAMLVYAVQGNSLICITDVPRQALRILPNQVH